MSAGVLKTIISPGRGFLLKKILLVIAIGFFIRLDDAKTEEKNIQFICKTNNISKKYTFLYIPSRNRIIWVQKGREMKIDNREINSISFTGFGVYGLGYDSWFQSKIYFKIDLKNGNFQLTADNIEHKIHPQKGSCLNKDTGKN